MSAAGGQCSLELHNGHAALALAVIAEAEGLDRFIAAQVCLHGLAQRAGALAVDDGDFLELGHDGVVEETLGRGDGLHRVHAAQVDLRLGGHIAQAGCVRGGKLLRLGLLVFEQVHVLFLGRHVHDARAQGQHPLGGDGRDGCLGAIWILRFLSGKKTILHLRKENFKLQKDIILPCLALGISTFVMLSTESILSVSFTFSLSRYGGDLAVGAMTIITSVSQLATLPLQGICQGGQPIMSYNFGARNKERVKKAFFTQFTVCIVFTSCFWLIMLLFPKLFAGIFSNNTDLITYTTWALRIYMAGIFSLGFQVACQQSFMALGQAKVSLLLACLRKLILLIPLIFILPCFIQNKVFAVFLAEPISDILAAIITTLTFFSRFNKILDRQ